MHLFEEETNYDHDKISNLLENLNTLNIDQKAVFDTIIDAINNVDN